MQTIFYRDQGKLPTIWSKLSNRLIYLPGAVIMLYGIWLLLSA